VLSYDRLILNADIDAYISFDNEKGRMQAEGVVKLKPKGNYYLLGGAPTDNNAKMLREGQMKVLKPLIDKRRYRRRPAVDQGLERARRRCPSWKTR
jgi:D-xylose transport system substrate-binding protein